MKELRGIRLGILAAMCGLIASGVGIISNIAGLFFEPMAETLGTGRGAVSVSLTICNLVFALGGMMSAKIVTPARFKPALLAGTVLEAGATALISAIQGVTGLYVLNAVRGFAAGILGFVLVTGIINRWFTRNTALITSIVLGWSGLTAAIFSPLVSAFLLHAGWRRGCLLCAGLIAVLNLPALVLPFGLSPDPYIGEEPKTTDMPEDRPKVNHSLLAAGILVSVCSSAVASMPQHFPGLSSSYLLPVTNGSAMLSVCMLSNTGGKLLFGMIADRISSKTALRLFSALMLVALLMLFIPRPAVLLAASLLAGFTYAVSTVGIVVLTKDLFGLERYDAIYPGLSFAGSVSYAVFSSLIGFMYDGSNSYASSLILLAAVNALMLAAILYAYRKPVRTHAGSRS